jgi:hypothetical protein
VQLAATNGLQPKVFWQKLAQGRMRLYVLWQISSLTLIYVSSKKFGANNSLEGSENQYQLHAEHNGNVHFWPSENAPVKLAC